MIGLENIAQYTSLRAGNIDPTLTLAHKATTYSLIFAFELSSSSYTVGV